MILIIKLNKNISYFGEFVNKTLEKEYFDFEIKKSMKYIRPILLLLGVLYFLFIIPDYFLIRDTNVFKIILINRTIFFVLIILFYYKLKKSHDYSFFSTWITAYKIICAIFFIHTYYFYESPNFLIQCYGVMIIIISGFLIPNKWINKLFASIIISSSFFIVSFYYVDSMIKSHYLAGVIYTLIVIILNAVSSFRVHYYKRVKYLDEKELIKLSTVDSLTQIYNRFKFNEEVEKWIKYCNRYKCDLCLIFFDIDDFKEINDKFGHVVGDNVLKDLANIVKELIRETDIFARWGGEEFSILLPNTNKDEAIKIAQRVRRQIENFSFQNGCHITCSFGIDNYNSEKNINDFIDKVDKLLYKAKKSGKNKIIFDYNK